MMRTAKLLLLLTVFSTFGLSSCDKDNEPGVWMRFRVSELGRTSFDWLTDNITVQFQQERLVVTGTNADGSSVQIITDRAAEGLYMVESGEAVAVFNQGGGIDLSKIFVADSGEVVISTNDLGERLVQGTFNASFYNEPTDRTIRLNGSFRSFY